MQHTSSSKAVTAPHPDDDRKPDGPTDLAKPTWKYILKKTAREFSKDQCTDLAAALTYYAVLALFPALLAVVSLLSIFHQGQQGTQALMGIVKTGRPQRREHAAGHHHSTHPEPLRGPRADPRTGCCAVVRIRLHRGIRPGHEPHLRNRRRPPVLQAASG